MRRRYNGGMAKKREGEPSLSAPEYGRSLPAFTVNLLVRDVARSAAFYREVFGAEVRYADADFAAMRMPASVAGGQALDFMLHADHTYEGHPWNAHLVSGEHRGLGADLRLFGVDPDALERRAYEAGAMVLGPATDKPHGWREVWVEDPDGYVWAAGRAIGG